VLTVGAQWFIYLFILRGDGVRLVGPAIAALASGFSVLKAQHYAEQRRINDLRRFHVIAEANHHVRNALQVLINPECYSNDQNSAEMLRDAVRRIEWVLTDVLPALDGDKTDPSSSPE
jgi:hypothetical protein